MQALLSVLLKIVVSVAAIVLLMRITSPVMVEPEAHRFLNMETAGIWSSAPVRVERASQDYQRIPAPPDPFPFKFRADRKFKALDSARFQYDGKIYHISGAPLIPRNRICRNPAGAKYACGLNAFKALDNSMRGRFVECKIGGAEQPEATVTCRVNGIDVAEFLRKEIDS